MFICCECGKMFEDIAIWREYRGECFGDPSYEELWGSPCCYGNYVEAKECSCCGEYITDTYVETYDGRRYCSECYIERELEDED